MNHISQSAFNYRAIILYSDLFILGGKIVLNRFPRSFIDTHAMLIDRVENVNIVVITNATTVAVECEDNSNINISPESATLDVIECKQKKQIGNKSCYGISCDFFLPVFLLNIF